jgi:phosphonate dehydrogenase
LLPCLSLGAQISTLRPKAITPKDNMPNKIVVTNPIHDEVRQRLAQYGEVIMNPLLEPWHPSELAEHLSTATAMMGFMTDRVDAALLKQAPQLKIVACALKGFDNYDVAACTQQGIWFSIVPDLLTEPTAELALGLAIALGRHVRLGDQQLRTKAFDGWRAQFFGQGLHNSIAAVVGLGLVGQAITQRLVGFGCKSLLSVDPQTSIPGIASCTLAYALQHADYVFVAVPLTTESLNLIDQVQLAKCKRGQLLINVGRGSVVNEQAVAQALESGRLAGYAADVFACEDWALSDRPHEIEPRLLAHSATVFTPHLGSAVRSVRLAIEQRAADNIIAVLTGSAPPDALNVPL